MKHKKTVAPAQRRKRERGEIEILSAITLPPASELGPANNLAKYGKKNGDAYFALVEEWLVEAHHLGEVLSGEGTGEDVGRFSIEEESHPKRNDLLTWFLSAVAFNGHLALRRFAAAVRRVHARKTFVGDRSPAFPFHVPPLDPALAEIAENSVGGTLPTKAREISQALSQAGGSQISDRTARRRRSDLGLKPGMPGRPQSAHK